MIDIEDLGVHLLGHPVRYVTEAVWKILQPDVQASVAEVVRHAVDTATSREYADMYFLSDMNR